MNQYPREFEEDEADANISPFIREYMRRLDDGSWPKMTIIATPTGIGHLKSMYERMHRRPEITRPIAFATPPPETEWLHDECLGNRRYMPLNLDFSEAEKRIAAAFHVPSEFLKMGLGKSYGHMLPEYYTELMKVTRIREERVAREAKRLAELVDEYGKEAGERVKLAADKLSLSLEQCIDLYKKFNSQSFKFKVPEGIEHLAVSIRAQIGEPSKEKKAVHAKRDRIPVPKTYKRNRHSK